MKTTILKKEKRFISISLLIFLFTLSVVNAQENTNIKHNTTAKTIRITDDAQNLSLLVDYSKGCKIKELNVKGVNVLSTSGVFTTIQTEKTKYSSDQHKINPMVTTAKNEIKIQNILLEKGIAHETWIFRVHSKSVEWTIQRTYEKSIQLEDMACPVWNFKDLSVWKGGIFDNGGMVWCKYLGKNDTYGIHTAGVTFWNPTNGHALRITPKIEKGKYPAAKYSQTEAGEFTCTQYVTDNELGQRYHQNRFVEGKTDVFAPFTMQKGKTTLILDIQYVDYAKEYTRGNLPGIDTQAVRELMNTTGRYGVVDNRIIGANGWVTNWKCLHEPFFAQIGMALNDPNYTANFSSTLDQERDQAMLNDGRVLSRWHGVPGDEIPGTYNEKTGYYEAMWGYTVDSQTGYIINTAEQFDLCGDVNWLKSHKESCEKALNWLIRRDTNNNGIFEMVNQNIHEEKASDWLDIVWAGFENAFVNAQMYEALNLWAECERILGDTDKSAYYLQVAQRLKTAFNRPVNEGGFWYPEKKQYIYWRDNDGSIHGDNLVTPVNFAVLAFGLCDDPQRISTILEHIESRTTAENLFHWPLCFDSYKREEVHENNWPFPKYENGDIFPTWGYLGIRAYVNHDKAIALKYIRNILEQYNKDGLSSQRYSRTTQLGLGTDILAGISTTVTALYRDIYGIRPKWNRMGLEPNLSDILNGTEFDYTLRNEVYHLKLSVNNYEMSTSNFSIKSENGFGAVWKDQQLAFYPYNREEQILMISPQSPQPVDMRIGEWNDDEYSWTLNSAGNYSFTIHGLASGDKFQLLINGKAQSVETVKDGQLTFSTNVNPGTVFRLQKKS